jgi:type II secretory pathway pseudopilin PulG
MKIVISNQNGFSLIELIAFIIISALLANTLLLSLNASLTATPQVQNQYIANKLADSCMGWYVGQTRLNGFSATNCSNTPMPNQNTFCPSTVGNFNTAITVYCTTDLSYETIIVTVTGPGNATLSAYIGQTY